MDERLYYIWLSRVCGAGSRLAVRLLREFGTASAVYAADEAAVRQAMPEDAARAWKLIAGKQTAADEDVLAFCDSHGVTVLVPEDARYPKSLLELRDYPVVLFAVGKLPDLNASFRCAVVGTRKMTDYGKESAYRMGYGLAAGGAVVVSGLALGVDGMAMAGALEAGGVTVGVLGSGIDVVYPPAHKDLMRRVIATGAVVTEYFPGTPPAAGNFPKRNRIISGLAAAVVVVEADAQSGALITARHALYQGRELYAVPGRINDVNAEGTNRLIKEGAHAVSEAAEVLARFEFLYPHAIRLRAAKAAGRQAASAAEETAGRLHVVARGEKRPFYGTDVYGGKERPARKPEVAAKPAEESRIRKPAGEKPAEQTAPPRVDFDLLGETERKVYDLLIPDVPMLPDELFRKGTIPLSSILSSLTMLEIAGAVEAGAGGYYLRRSGDGFDPADDGKYE